MKSRVPAVGWFVVGVQALLLVAVAVLLRRSTADTLTAANDLAQLHEVNTHLVHVKVALGRVEDMLDAYLDKASPARRSDYERAVAILSGRQADLREVAKEGGIGGSDEATVEQAVEQTLATFARIEELQGSGPELIQGLLTPDTKTPLYAAYRSIDSVLDHQRARLNELQASLDSETESLDRVLIAAGLVALLLQASVVVLIERDQRRRRALQSALRSQNELLEATVAERTTSLTQAKEELAWVSQRALQLQERERQFLALELHDQIGQQIAALRMILQHVEAQLSQDSDPELVASVRDAIEVTAATYGQIHDIAMDLRPAMLDRFGLVPTLEWYARQQAARGRCDIKVLSGALPTTLPAELLTAAFRIAQEAVSNALSHGKPKNIDVNVMQVGEFLELKIVDDGAGFDPRTAQPSDPSTRHFGLLGMRERASSIGGAVTITSTPGVGTSVAATFPLTVANREAAEAPAAPAPLRAAPLPSAN